MANDTNKKEQPTAPLSREEEERMKEEIKDGGGIGTIEEATQDLDFEGEGSDFVAELERGLEHPDLGDPADDPADGGDPCEGDEQAA